MNNVIGILDWKVQKIIKAKAGLKRLSEGKLSKKALERLEKDLNK